MEKASAGPQSAPPIEIPLPPVFRDAVEGLAKIIEWMVPKYGTSLKIVGTDPDGDAVTITLQESPQEG